MKVKLISVGNKLPSWINEGCQEYLKRLGGWLNVQLIEVAPSKRQKNDSAADQLRYKQLEGEIILSLISPHDHVVALEVLGKNWSTPELAMQIEKWSGTGKDVVLIIGGPDGLSDAVRTRANQQWSLSALTMPHPIARLVVTEQLYRATSINKGHPYHRE